MLRSSLPEKQIQGNPLEFHLRAFATSLLESGYQKRTIQDKLPEPLGIKLVRYRPNDQLLAFLEGL